MTPEEIRRHSVLLLAHARQLREEAELARARSAQRRARSERAIASAQQRRLLVTAVLNRRPCQSSATDKEPS